MARPIQLHLTLPFRHRPLDHPRLRSLLEQGYRIRDLQRLTDEEVVVTLRPLPRRDTHANPDREPPRRETNP